MTYCKNCADPYRTTTTDHHLRVTYAGESWERHDPATVGTIMIVSSSHGYAVVTRETGEVIQWVIECQEPDCPVNPVRFDVQEWRAYHWSLDDDVNPEEVDDLDILDIGYWDTAGRFTGPEHEWRREKLEGLPPGEGPCGCGLHAFDSDAHDRVCIHCGVADPAITDWDRCPDAPARDNACHPLRVPVFFPDLRAFRLQVLAALTHDAQPTEGHGPSCHRYAFDLGCDPVCPVCGFKLYRRLYAIRNLLQEVK